MTRPIEFSVVASDELARVGRVRTPHGEIATPVFMPVGTRAAVKAMAPDELWNIGYRLVLANAYHLLVRPGPDLVRALGGVFDVELAYSATREVNFRLGCECVISDQS